MRFARVVLALAGVVLAGTQAFGANVKFATAVTYPSGADGANAVVVVDVNGDGFPDLIVATNNGVSVLLNQGNGTFGPSTTFATGGTYSQGLAVQDVNGDGIPDIVVTNMCLDPTDCSGVAVLIGNGDGTFQSAVGYDSGGLLTGGVAVGVLRTAANGGKSGFPDLVVTSHCQIYTCVGGTTNVLLNNGDGTFGKPVQVADNSGPVALGDMTNNGILDLVTGAGVMLGNGDGTFQQANQQVVGGANSIALADVNLDGILDVIVPLTVGEGGAGQVAVQLGNGDGTLQSAMYFSTGGANPFWVAIADYNGDTFPDLAVINECTSAVKGTCGATATASVGVLSGNGDGTFNSPVGFGTEGSVGTSVATGNIAGIGKADLAAANACTSSNNCTVGSVSVLLNDYLVAVSISLQSSMNPVVLNQPVTFTATLSSGSAVPNGETVTFTSNGTTLGTPTTSGGVASVTTSFSATGKYTITASYPGDLYHLAKSVSMTEKVVGYPTTTALTVGPNPSNYGQGVTMTAVVISSGGVIPTGTVKFINGTTSLGTATLNSSGTATFSTTKLPLGTDTITAYYLGDTSNAASTSSAVPQMVNQAQLTMTLSSTPNPSTLGKGVKFTATLTSNGGLPSGTVAFSYNGTQLGTGTLSVTTGEASFTTDTLPAGSDVVTATFTGTADYSSASASVTQVVN